VHDAVGYSSEVAAALVGAEWKKSSWSAANGHCVEVAWLGSHVGVRNSRDNAPGRPVLIFSREEWESFLSGVYANDFNLPSTASS
jgi:Domain of unknown function (DUF397)